MDPGADIALAPLPPAHAAAPMCVALSGGLDSSVLLAMAASSAALRGNGLRALHVHHGLHHDADAWSGHCQRACDALGVPLQVLRVAVEADGEGPEAAARRARHAAFAAALRDGEVLALAHHRDDQAETFLLRALRASGVDGLAAMRPWRPLGAGWLWRPLLDLPRHQLLAYATAHGLSWIEDPANVDTRLDRNFLRHEVLPMLRRRWPQADAAFSRSAALAAEAAALLDDGDAAALAGARLEASRSLSIPVLRTLPAARRTRVLRRWVADCGLPPLPARGVARIEADLLREDDGDGIAEFRWGDAAVRRWRGALHALRVRPPLPGDYRVPWDGSAPLRLPTGDVLALVAREGNIATAAPGEPDAVPCARDARPPWTIHARAGGERLVLPGRAHSHALKHVLQDLAVPPWDRARMPLLSAADGRLLAAGDRVQSAAFDAWLRRGGLCLRLQSPPGFP